MIAITAGRKPILNAVLVLRQKSRVYAEMEIESRRSGQRDVYITLSSFTIESCASGGVSQRFRDVHSGGSLHRQCQPDVWSFSTLPRNLSYLK